MRNEADWNQYYNDVKLDFNEMSEQYPFCYLTIPPTIKPSEAVIRVIAVNKGLISMVDGVETDFIGTFSKELYIHVPLNYKNKGCIVYGGNWIKTEKLVDKDIHFFKNNGKLIRTQYGFQLCVGTPESFMLMDNVILENVKTAENMLIAYERVMAGKTDTLEMIAYEHGERGRKQFLQNRKKYVSGRQTDGKIK